MGRGDAVAAPHGAPPNGNVIHVAKEGAADFSTIGEALASLSDEAGGRTIIHIGPGVYFEKLSVMRPRVTLLGSGSRTTILRFDDHAKRLLPSGEPMGTFNSYTLYVGGVDFQARDLSVENSAGDGRTVGQGIACYVDADRVSFFRCGFAARQDTLCCGPLPANPLPKGINTTHPVAIAGQESSQRPFRHYFRECGIEGDVDFIFGSAAALFEDCEILSLERGERVNGYIAAPSTLPGQAYGFVFLRCRLRGNARKGSVFLGRPWRPTAKASFIDCDLGDHIAAEGWDNWGNPANEGSAIFAELGSRGPGAPADFTETYPGSGPSAGRRVSWAQALAPGEVSRFTPRAILSGDDGWDPWADWP